MAKKNIKRPSVRDKWIFVIAVFAILFITFLAIKPKHVKAPTQITNNSTNETANTKTFTDSEGKFSFEYPGNWEINNEKGSNAVNDLESRTIVIQEIDNQPFVPNIRIVVYPGLNNLSFNDFLKQYWCPSAEVSGDDPDLISSCKNEIKTQDNANGTQFSVSNQISLLDGKNGPAAWITNADYAVFIYSDFTHYADSNDMKIFNQILNSFKFTN